MTSKPFTYAGREVIFDEVAGSEHHLQTRFIVKCRDHEDEYPMLRFLFAIPNGGQRQRMTAIILKDEGVKRGVPDVCLPVPRGGYHGWWCEFKFNRGTPSEDQEDFIAHLRLQGYYVCVYWSADEAFKDLITYLELPVEAAPTFQHSDECGIKYRYCAPYCPIELAKRRAATWPQPALRLF